MKPIIDGKEYEWHDLPDGCVVSASHDGNSTHVKRYMATDKDGETNVFTAQPNKKRSWLDENEYEYDDYYKLDNTFGQAW